ncbi:MAG TPA: 7TM-DISM domain-containing protein [Leptospiraceae bacterium]|nr:7TM-DISM domain-containing protein [Leptospiraceae bacterium]HMY67392.1 7TM-DISM domain-containing protein [Leptospiraceae bacterium]HNF15918.1 7TM-DISM domain-containing protein [Leptospiraceae bacterium]HNF22823.1 7TM-DISM domain-containing protein [Leptospiraceae bacterium]HNI98826.1 7TM-DISM domain-containing protein [Leptospiraceae bacterium]
MNALYGLLFLLFAFFSNCSFEGKRELVTEIVNLSGEGWFIAFDDNPDFSKPELETKGWQEIEIPGNVRHLDSDHTGKFWLRKNFELDASGIKKNLALTLGKVYERDEVYLNGKLIGINGKRPDDIYQTEYAYNRGRIYPIPANALNAGKNVLAVRISSDIKTYKGIISGENGIGTLYNANDWFLFESVLDLIYVSVFLFIGIFFLINYLKLPEMKEYLAFSFFIIEFSLYELTRNEFRFFVWDNFIFFKLMEYILLYNIPFFYLNFFQRFFKAEPLKHQKIYFLVNALIPVIFVIFRSPALWTQMTSIWSYHLILPLGYTGWVAYNKMKENDRDGYIYGVALFYFVYGVLKEVMIEKAWITADSSIDSALLFFVMTITVALRFRFISLKLSLQKRFEQLREIDRLREKIFQYMNRILTVPLETSIQSVRAMKVDPSSFSKDRILDIGNNYSDMDSALDDIMELSRLEVKTDSPLKDTVPFTDFIKFIIPEGQITYTIKVNPAFEIHNTLDLINSLMVRIIDYEGFKNFTSKDLIITSDLNDQLHFRFMFYHKDPRVTQSLYKQLSDPSIRNISDIRWSIIKETLRLVEGELQMALINKKYLRVDFGLQALPLKKEEAPVKPSALNLSFNIDFKNIDLKNIKLPDFKNIRFPWKKDEK